MNLIIPRNIQLDNVQRYRETKPLYHKYNQHNKKQNKNHEKMRNARIYKKTKDNKYVVQIQMNLILFKIWISLRNDNNEEGFKYMKPETFTKLKTYLIPIAAITLLCLLNYWIVGPFVTFFAVLVVLLDFATALYGIYFVTIGFLGGFFDVNKHRLEKYAENELKNYAERQQEKQKKNDEIKKHGKGKTIGVLINGQYVNGEQLERWKKLERIIDEETI